jgi:hypothetical protein
MYKPAEIAGLIISACLDARRRVLKEPGTELASGGYPLSKWSREARKMHRRRLSACSSVEAAANHWSS